MRVESRENHLNDEQLLEAYFLADETSHLQTCRGCRDRFILTKISRSAERLHFVDLARLPGYHRVGEGLAGVPDENVRTAEIEPFRRREPYAARRPRHDRNSVR